MRLLVPAAMFVAGVGMVAAAVISGEADVSLVVVFPVFSGSSALFLLGTLLVVAGFVTGFAMLAMGGSWDEYMSEAPMRDHNASTQRPRREFGGVVLIGPIPIAFGSDKRIAVLMLIAGVVLAVVLIGVLIGLS